jgi:hypothetical protein
MNKVVDCYFCDEFLSYGSKRDPGYFSVYGNFLEKSLYQKIKENFLEKGLDQKDEDEETSDSEEESDEEEGYYNYWDQFKVEHLDYKLVICDDCKYEYNEFGTGKGKYKSLEKIYTSRCVVCKEINKTLEFQSCTHRVCIDCYRNYYYGYNDDPQPLHVLELEGCEELYRCPFSYKLIDEFNEYIDSILKNADLLTFDIENYKKQVKSGEIKNRPWWMDNDKNLKYEFKYIENKILTTKTKYEWNKWIEAKYSNKKYLKSWENDNYNKPEEELFITLKCPECI